MCSFKVVFVDLYKYTQFTKHTLQKKNIYNKSLNIIDSNNNHIIKMGKYHYKNCPPIIID